MSKKKIRRKPKKKEARIRVQRRMLSMSRRGKGGEKTTGVAVERQGKPGRKTF